MNVKVNPYNMPFEGEMILAGKFSRKPQACIAKVRDNISQLIKPKDFNLYFQQDYKCNVVNITADSSYSNNLLDKSGSRAFIPITSKASNYLETSKNLIEKHEKFLIDKGKKEWELEQKQRKKSEMLDSIESVIFAPLFILELVLYDISPKLGKNYEKLLKKIGL